MKIWPKAILGSLSIWAAALLFAQEAAEQPGSLFVRASIYPTASLSRYDYNIDIDLYEIRAYVELRDKSPAGEFLANARVAINSQTLEYKTNQYETALKVPPDRLVSEVELFIQTADGRQVREKFPLPQWLILTSPRPQKVSNSGDLKVKWEFSRFSSPVNIQVYDFKAGDMIYQESDLETSEIIIPAGKLPKSTIVRFYVITSWLYKRYLLGNAYVQGSEINVIPWSQVFLRIEEKQKGESDERLHP